jgi:hypothetical protein
VCRSNEEVEGKRELGAHGAVSLEALAITADAVPGLGAGILLIHAAWPSYVAAWGGMLGLLLVIRLLVVIILHSCVSIQKTLPKASCIFFTTARHASAATAYVAEAGRSGAPGCARKYLLNRA